MISKLHSIKPQVWLLMIVLFGFLIRFYGVNIVPPSLNWDEVSHGYNAYSILQTGRDEWGVSFPTIFRAYGDYKLPVYIYLTVISEFFLGLSALAVRFPSILSGTLSILFTYLLVKELFKKETMAIAASLFVAISPWSFFLSRVALEANVAVFLVISGIYFFFLGLGRKNKYLVLSILMLGLSVWTYNSARVFVPLLILAVATIYKTELLKILKENRRTAVMSSIVFFVFFIPMFVQLSQSTGQARYTNVQIIDQGAIGRIEELRNNSAFGNTFNRLIFNKGTYFTTQFAKNYINHFSPNFLFLNGGDNYQFNVPNMGLLYWVNAPFFILGIWDLVKNKRKDKHVKLIIAWLLISPIAASITREAPHTLRSIVMLPIPMILSAIGIVYFIEKVKKARLVIAIFSILLLISFADYSDAYLNNYRRNYSWSWQYGYEQVADRISTDYDTYEKFIITKKYGEPHEFVLFYLKWDPAKFLNEDKIRYAQSDWFWVDNFDKFYFVNDWDIPTVGSTFELERGEKFDCASCLLITSLGNAPENWKKIDTINFLDGEVAFEIYEH